MYVFFRVLKIAWLKCDVVDLTEYKLRRRAVCEIAYVKKYGVFGRGEMKIHVRKKIKTIFLRDHVAIDLNICCSFFFVCYMFWGEGLLYTGLSSQNIAQWARLPKKIRS